ncbi:MAG: metallophosphoesterase [Pseudomonadota bacterium]
MSDPHLPLPNGTGRDLRFKQRLGRRSWLRKRQRRHRPEVLAALLDDIRTHGPDHIALGGDLINIALPEEFELARDWLTTLGPPQDVTLVPGNHDSYVANPAGLDLWRPWMTGDDGTTTFPFRRDRGPVSFIGLSTAVPKPPVLATGTLGPDQLARAEPLLQATKDRIRIVLIHHPVDNAASPRKALTDRTDLQAVLARTGADLVLHGHLHHAHMGLLQGPDRPIPVIGVPSASMIHDTDKGDPARWLDVQINGPRITITARGLTPDGFATLSRLSLNTAS